jgi:hypothetical protein
MGIVVIHIFGQGGLQLPLVEDQQAVQQLSP